MQVYQCHFCGRWLDGEREGEPKAIKVNEEPSTAMGARPVGRFRLICPPCLQQLRTEGWLPSPAERSVREPPSPLMA